MMYISKKKNYQLGEYRKKDHHQCPEVGELAEDLREHRPI
jgi:hypothetical protein